MKDYIGEKISIIPIHKGKKNPAISSWKKYQSEIMSEFEYDINFIDKDVAMVAGLVSGNLMCLDFDNKLNNADVILSDFMTDEHVAELFQKYNFAIQSTPSGGFHVVYRCEAEVGGNIKLARQINEKTQKPEVLIETRGEGGYFLVDPSVGYKIIEGSFTNIPIISKDEHNTLINTAKSLNVFYDKPQGQNRGDARGDNGETAGDAFNRSPEALDQVIGALTRNGWKSTNNVHWVRPSKPKGGGISATLGKAGDKVFYVFSSNAYPFDDGVAYSPFAVLAMLEHNGDYSACAKELATKGYGYNLSKAKADIANAAREAKDSGRSLSDSEIEDLSIDHKMPLDKVRDIADTAVSTKKKATSKKVRLIDAEGYIASVFDIRYNNVKNLIEFKHKGESTYRELNIYDIMRQASLDGMELSETMVNSVVSSSTGIRVEYDPFKAAMEDLPKWDGVDHIGALCDFFTLTHEHEMPFFKLMMKKSMIRTIKCAIEPNYYNRMVMTLISPRQELGKSYFLRWLNVVGSDYYNETPLSDKKDALISYTTSFLYNIEELDNLNRTGLSLVKSIISLQHVNQRLPYAKQATQTPRRCSFWATTNKRDFLEEVSNSRWLCFDIDDIDRRYSIKIDKKKLWSQAYAALLEGDDGELTIEERNMRDGINKSFTEETDETAIIPSVLDVDNDGFLSNAKIISILKERTVLNNTTTRKIGKAMALLGYKQKKQSNVRGWGACEIKAF